MRLGTMNARTGHGSERRRAITAQKLVAGRLLALALRDTWGKERTLSQDDVPPPGSLTSNYKPGKT